MLEKVRGVLEKVMSAADGWRLPAAPPARTGIRYLAPMTDTADALPPCPSCSSPYTYQQGPLLICPECAFEWTPTGDSEEGPAAPRVIRDANGNVLADGDTVTVIKDLKVKGTSLVVKVGTKVRNIRLAEGDHDIDCRIDGVGSMGLKSEFVRKV